MNITISNARAIVNGLAAPFKPSPNIGGSLKPEYIVLHDTGSGLNDSGSVSWLTDKASKVSAHVVIGRDGRITQLVPFNVKAWHAGQSVWRGRALLNGFSIGIEIINPGRLSKVAEGVYKGVCTIDTNKDRSLVVKHAKTTAHGDGYWLAYSDAQLAAITSLCAAICADYPIKEIVTHWLISPGRKIDTNPLFPLEQVRLACLGGAKPMGIVDTSHQDSDESATDADDVIPIGTEDDATSPAEIAASRPVSDESAGGLGQVWKLVKSKTQWATTALGGISLTSLFGFLQDWRVLAVMGAVAVALVALIIFERSRKP
jgi:N-acetylmuramoyl-L-alanine amidase